MDTHEFNKLKIRSKIIACVHVPLRCGTSHEKRKHSTQFLTEENIPRGSHPQKTRLRTPPSINPTSHSLTLQPTNLSIYYLNNLASADQKSTSLPFQHVT